MKPSRDASPGRAAGPVLPGGPVLPTGPILRGSAGQCRAGRGLTAEPPPGGAAGGGARARDGARGARALPRLPALARRPAADRGGGGEGGAGEEQAGAGRSEEALRGAMSAPAGLPPRPAAAAAFSPGGPGSSLEAAAPASGAPRCQNGEGPARGPGGRGNAARGVPGTSRAAPAVAEAPGGAGGLRAFPSSRGPGVGPADPAAKPFG